MRSFVLLVSIALTTSCWPFINDQPLEPAPAPPPQCCFEGEPEPEGEGEGEGTGEIVPCALEVDCFTDEANEALGGYGMCIAGVCEPLFTADFSVGRFDLAVDTSTGAGSLDVEAPRYFVEVYAPIRGNGEALTCLDAILGPFDPEYAYVPPYLGNGMPADANIIAGSSSLEATTTESVSMPTTAIPGRQIVRFGIHENADASVVPLAIACLEVEFPSGLNEEDFDFNLFEDPNVPFLGGVVLSPL